MLAAARTLVAVLAILILAAGCGEAPSGEPNARSSPIKVLRNGKLLTELPVEELREIPRAGTRWTLDEVFSHLGEPTWFYVQIGRERFTPTSKASLGIEDGRVNVQRAGGRVRACHDMHLAVAEGRADTSRAAKGATPKVFGLGNTFDLDATQLGRVPSESVLRRGSPANATPLWDLLFELSGSKNVHGVRLSGHRGHSLELVRPTDGSPRWSRVYLMRNNRGGIHVLLDAAPAESKATSKKAGGGGHGSSRAQGRGKDPQSTGELRHLTKILVMPAAELLVIPEPK